MRILHYSLMSVLLVFNLACLVAGGHALWLGFAAAVFLSTIIDEAAGDDLSDTARLGAPVWLFNAMLYATLPLLALNCLAFAALIGGGPLDLSAFGLGSSDVRAATSAFDLIGGVLALGLLLGSAGINVAHELIHRTGDKRALNIGRWLLAFSFDTSFAIEHVYGHHRNVATEADPATARRGEYLLAFVWRSLTEGNRSAWKIETGRLEQKGLAIWSVSNRMLTWQLASLVLLAGWWILGGWMGVLIAIVSGAMGKFYLEAVNYIEHYGLVRVPGSPVEPRHSWNCYHGVTNGMLYNLARHSHHHRFAAKPFWKLEVEPDGPEMPHGYMTMIIASLIPPVWQALMTPRLEVWDRDMASPAELALLKGA